MNTKDIPKIELKAVGEKVTLCVEQFRKLPFGKFPEAEICGQIGTGDMVALVMPMPAAVKQLTNLGLEAMNADGQFMGTVGKYLTIKRSENKTNAARPYWDIYLARAGEFEEGAGPIDEFEEELRAEGARNRTAQNARAAERPARVQPPPVEPSAPAPAPRPRAADPVTSEELTDGEKKKRGRMRHLRTVWRGLWKDEAIAQLSIALEIAKEHPELPRLDVTAVSVNAGAASQFIEFNRGNLL